ncbi:MAG: VanZ family protein [Tyzzerella sp.]|nr:VanZ family protein [Tyzzerella sp.]
MKNKKLIFIIGTMLWTAVIFTFSLQPGEVSGDLSGSILETLLGIFMPGVLESPEKLELFHLILRKCAHFTEFLILGVLSRNAMHYMPVQFKGISAMAFCLSIAAIDETIQLFVGGRAGRVQDVLIDSVGALTGILAILFLIKQKTRRSKL